MYPQILDILNVYSNDIYFLNDLQTFQEILKMNTN